MTRLSRFRIPPRLWFAASVPLLLLGAGGIGYKIIGGSKWSWLDAIYMSAITLTTVGYDEVHPLDESGRLFTIVFLFAGVFLLFYSATEMIRAAVTGELRATLGRESVKQALEDIHDHIIVCGLGRMGNLVCKEFDRTEERYVLIDLHLPPAEEWPGDVGVPLQGDATDDNILKRAGVERAKVLVTVLPSDSDNLYVTLTARVMNPTLFIVARAEQESSEAKLRRVGANQVVSPYVIGGHRIAQAVLRPTLGHFLDKATQLRDAEYQIEEVAILAGSPLAGKTLRQAKLRDEMGIVVVVMKLTNGEIVFSPKGDSPIEPGSILVVIGRREQLNELDRIAAGLKKPD